MLRSSEEGDPELAKLDSVSSILLMLTSGSSSCFSPCYFRITIPIPSARIARLGQREKSIRFQSPHSRRTY